MVPDRIDVDELVVRTYRRADAAALADAVAASVEHLRPWMPWIADEPLGVRDREAWIEDCRGHRNAGGDTTYGIFEGDRVVGGTGLHRRRGPDILEIGYWVHADACGRGIATRVSAALTDVALREAGVVAVEIRHDRRNVLSGRIPRRLGFALMEEARRRPQAPGESGLLLRWCMTGARWADLTCEVRFPRSPAGWSQRFAR